jgi:hypothetical protein
VECQRVHQSQQDGLKNRYGRVVLRGLGQIAQAPGKEASVAAADFSVSVIQLAAAFKDVCDAFYHGGFAGSVRSDDRRYVVIKTYIDIPQREFGGIAVIQI